MEQRPIEDEPIWRSARYKEELGKIALRKAFENIMSASDERLITREEALEILDNGSWQSFEK